MSDKSRKLGIIAGGSTIPKRLIDECVAQGRDFFVLCIEGNADETYFTDAIPHKWIRIGQSGTGFKLFKDEKVQDVVMIGTIKRPTLSDLIPDLRTTMFFTKIAAKSLGDDGILRALANDIEHEGMKIKGVHEVMPEILAREGIMTKTKPDKQALQDIKRGVEVCLELGRLDVGQAVIVQQGLILAVEGIEGTDKLIERTKDYQRKGEKPILVKLRKPNQDMRLDLPTIGLRTIEKAIESGLRGVAVHAGNALMVDEKEAIELANKHNIFIIGINPADYVKE
ncbi:MAG: UDP-2,3-diacylglucosamine diphosphatase LpxI [Alphaproteobacteria bacterium]|nr:UDP-2,3-diacylglucosamine diphosphatase LpxI [Alphaproteobacteria bacterium]